MGGLKRIAGRGDMVEFRGTKVWLNTYIRTPLILRGKTSKAVTKTKRKATFIKIKPGLY